MSLKNVQSFYKRLATDDAFRTQIQGVQSKNECSQVVKDAGYVFTQEEFEEYTVQFLESDSLDSELFRDVDENELAAVIGGFVNHQPGHIPPLYGIIYKPPTEPIAQPLYGIVVEPIEPIAQPLSGIVAHPAYGLSQPVSEIVGNPFQ